MEQSANLNVESIQGAASFARAFDVSRETLDRLEVYASLLRKWQATINLVASKSIDEVWQRHFADSAQLLRLAPGRRPLRWVDLGSGAGFPGLVIGVLIAEYPGSRLTLVESDSRKAAFLREVVRATGIGASVAVDIVVGRIESPTNQTRVGEVDVVSARALAPLPKLLQLSQGYMGPDTVALFLKGRDLVSELSEAKRLFAFEHAEIVSRTDISGRVLSVSHLRVA